MCRLAELRPGSHKVTSGTPLAADPEETRTRERARTTSFSASVVSGGFLSVDNIKSKKNKEKITKPRAKKKIVRRARKATARREDKPNPSLKKQVGLLLWYKTVPQSWVQ